MRILTTSREGLGLPEERLWRVSSLEVVAAVELFAERAESLSADESAAVEEVCRRLDGIPLAIELAASRMGSMTATEVRDRLDHRFKLLIGSRRGLERHQTLRHAVAWSYDLLDDGEKALLDRCSVFAGGFDLRSACAVAGSDNADEFAVPRCARCARAQVVARRRSVVGAHAVRDARDDPSVRGRTTRRTRRGHRGACSACPLLRGTRNRHLGPVGRPPTA